MMNFKRDTSQPERHIVRFKLTEDDSKKAVSFEIYHEMNNRHNSIILSDDENEKKLREAVKKSIEKFGLKVRQNCDTIITVIYHERNFKVLCANTTIINHIKKGE